ncbi:MAG TPA: papain-like cysteine protease family protein [Myxococcaceae bacterium]
MATRGPVWPAGLLQNDVFEPLQQRVEVRQTARALNQGTEVGVQDPLVLGGTLPAIDQQTPDGNGFYVNGNMNCGPTSMAMIARSDPDATINGIPVSSMTDAQLVMALGRVGDTDRSSGTSPNGEIAMAEAMGYQTASAPGGLHPVFINATLAAGGSVIVNGAVPIDGEIAGHYMVVTGKDTQGNYVVNDPWTGQTLTMTPEALDDYLKANPVNGGWSIAVW